MLEAFDGYWRKAPSVKRLVMRSMPEETTRAAALRAGEMDIVYLLTGSTAEALQKAPGYKVVAPLLSGAFWLELTEQWDPKSPWHDRRVRLAASHAIDRQAVNKAETLGFSRLTGNFVPRIFQNAVAYEPPAYDPARAKKLLAEAGYPNGFEGGDFYPFPPYNSMAEAIQGYLQAVGIRTQTRTMERATYFAASSWSSRPRSAMRRRVSSPTPPRTGSTRTAACRRSTTSIIARDASSTPRSARPSSTRSRRSSTIR